MGQLVALKYPTVLFAKAADHTYVQCGSGGKKWSCWGGNTGGMAFNQGTGSTARADKIATPSGKAGITCYLVNGVCHQAANRILIPAGILVNGARGYTLSSLIFGTYGKVGFLPCFAPLNGFPNVKGDLPECAAPSLATTRAPRLRLVPAERAHVRGIQNTYYRFERVGAAAHLDRINFQMNLFSREVTFRLKSMKAESERGLYLAKQSAELRHWNLIDARNLDRMRDADFVKEFNVMTHKFQDDIANALNKVQYRKLMGTNADERLTLADPWIVKSVFGAGVAREVYGQTGVAELETWENTREPI
jgi:hypothetical protein